MLEKPDIQENAIVASLQDWYGLFAEDIEFLPLGADPNTAVYRVVAGNGLPYFLKLRRGGFDATSVTLPKFLSDQGIGQIFAPVTTNAGQLWVAMDTFTLILYPFVEGRNGYAVALSARQWDEFGAAIKRIHTIVAPPVLTTHIQREIYSSQWRQIVHTFQARVEGESFVDPVAAELALFLQAKRADLLNLVGRTEQLAQALRDRSPEFVLCHSDLHAGNILIGPDDAFYIVDWDNPVMAPKERDLMFIGGAQGFVGCTAEEEATLFYRGYGPTQIDATTLAYYRYERIIQDIAVYCEQLLLSDEGGEDRELSLRYLKSNWLPNSTLERAYRVDPKN